MSVSEDLETRLRSLSIDRGSDKAHAHGQPALSTVPTQPKANPPRRIWRRVGGLLLLGVAGVVALNPLRTAHMSGTKKSFCRFEHSGSHSAAAGARPASAGKSWLIIIE